MPSMENILKRVSEGELADAAKFRELISKAELPDEGKAVETALMLLQDAKEKIDAETFFKLAKELGYEAAEPKPVENEVEKSIEVLKKAEFADEAKAVEAFKTAGLDEIFEKAMKLKKAEPPEENPDPLKDLTPEAQSLLKSQTEKMEALEKEHKEQGEKIAKMEDEKLTKEFIDEATANKAHLPEKAEDLGPILKEAKQKLDEESFKKLDVMLSTLSKQIAVGELLKELGSANTIDENSAEAKLEKMAQKLSKEDKDLTYEQAYEKALLDPENREIVTEMEREQSQRKEG